MQLRFQKKGGKEFLLFIAIHRTHGNVSAASGRRPGKLVGVGFVGLARQAVRPGGREAQQDAKTQAAQPRVHRAFSPSVSSVAGWLNPREFGKGVLFTSLSVFLVLSGMKNKRIQNQILITVQINLYCSLYMCITFFCLFVRHINSIV